MANMGREAYRKMDEELAKLGAPRGFVWQPTNKQREAKQEKLRNLFERQASSHIKRMLKKARRLGLSPRECGRRSVQIYASLRPAGLTTER